MKISWEWSLDSEVDRLIEMSSKVVSGFYRLHNFLILPERPHGSTANPSHLVYLPSLPYSSIPHYWSKVAKLDSGTYSNFDLLAPSLYPFLTTLNLSPLTLTDLQAQSRDILPQVELWLKHTFPNLPLPESVKIHPSYFGTLGSFSLLKKTSSVTLYLRSDQGIHTLVELYLSSVLRPNVTETISTDWERSEYLVDYLLTQSSLSNLLPQGHNWIPTTNPPHYPQELHSASKLYLQKLGIPDPSVNHFSLQGSQIYFGHLPLTTLSRREQAILSLLIQKSPIPVTIDEIADHIFASEDKFSLSAISKCIERLRRKLVALGISSDYLATASGIGYYLKN